MSFGIPAVSDSIKDCTFTGFIHLHDVSMLRVEKKDLKENLNFNRTEVLIEKNL